MGANKSKNISSRQARRKNILGQKRVEKKQRDQSKLSVIKRVRKSSVQAAKRFSLLFKITFSFFLTTAVVYWYFNSGSKQQIKAELIVHDKAVIAMRDGQSNFDSTEGKITPLCGCLLKREHRGIQFFSEFIQYEIADTSYNKHDSLHQYSFFAPQDNNGIEPYLEVKANCYFIRSKDVENIDIDTLLKGGALTFKYGNVDNKLESYFLKASTDTSALIMLTTKSNKLSIYTSNDFPIAAHLPAKNSRVGLTKYHDPYSRSNLGFEITELYDTHNYLEGQYEVPSLDLFGPRTVIITNSGVIRFDTKYAPINTSDTGYMAVLVFDAAPNLRIAHLKIDSSILKKQLDSSHQFILYKKSKGVLLLSSRVLAKNRFLDLKTKINSLGGEWRDYRNIWGRRESAIGLWGLPAVFNTNGIYIYTHNLSELFSNETGGNIKYGLKSISLTGQSEVLIANMNNDETYNQPMIFPLDDEYGEDEINWKFLTDGDLTVDGSVIRYNKFDNIFWKDFSSVIGIVTGILTLLLFFKDIFSKKISSVNSDESPTTKT